MRKRNVNSSVSSTTLQQFHVSDGGRIGDLFSHIFPLIAILVLNLVDENIASVADLMLRNNF